MSMFKLRTFATSPSRRRRRPFIPSSGIRPSVVVNQPEQPQESTSTRRNSLNPSPLPPSNSQPPLGKPSMSLVHLQHYRPNPEPTNSTTAEPVATTSADETNWVSLIRDHDTDTAFAEWKDWGGDFRNVTCCDGASPSFEKGELLRGSRYWGDDGIYYRS